MPALGDLIGTVVEGAGLSSPLGIGLVAVTAVAVVGRNRAKPLAKGAIRGGLALTRRVQAGAAELGEQWQDLYAEAKHEHQQEIKEAATARASETPRATKPSTKLETAG